MNVRVKVFAAPSMALESRELSLELPPEATVKDMLVQIPSIEWNYVYVVREGIRLTSTSLLRDGDEVLIVPPIAGG